MHPPSFLLNSILCFLFSNTFDSFARTNPYNVQYSPLKEVETVPGDRSGSDADIPAANRPNPRQHSTFGV